MKRSVLLLIPLVMGLASCSNSSTIPNQEVVDKVIALLNKQDFTESHSKYLRAAFTQEYDVLDICNEDYNLSTGEGEKSSSYFNYSGSGLFGMYYNLTDNEYHSVVDENGNVDIFDAIAEGKGYYGILQSARTMSFNRENGEEAKIYNLDIAQFMTLKSTDDDVWLENSLYVSDDGIFHYESRQALSASIDKELLFGSVSTRTFRQLFSQVNLFDAPGNSEHLDKHYYSICRDLVSKNDKEISDFLLANQVSIEEVENNIEVNFVYTDVDLEEEELDYVFPGEIKGTLSFNKTTYEFLGFDYDILYKLEAYDEDTGNIKIVNTKFHCEGESLRSAPEDSWEPTNPKVYDDVAEFLQDVNEQVVPPNINL